MDISKYLVATGIFFLVACVLLSLLSVWFLRNAIIIQSEAKNKAPALQTSAEDSETSPSLSKEDALQRPEKQQEESPPESVDADVLYDVFCVRAVHDKIGIYTAEGYLIRLLDVSPDTLPQPDRDALAEGICVTSWRELISLIEDYTG